MKMSVTTASTRNDRSRMASAGVEAGSNMLGVETTPVEAIRLMPYRRARRGCGDDSLAEGSSAYRRRPSGQLDGTGRLDRSLQGAQGAGEYRPGPRRYHAHARLTYAP